MTDKTPTTHPAPLANEWIRMAEALQDYRNIARETWAVATDTSRTTFPART